MQLAEKPSKLEGAVQLCAPADLIFLFKVAAIIGVRLAARRIRGRDQQLFGARTLNFCRNLEGLQIGEDRVDGAMSKVEGGDRLVLNATVFVLEDRVTDVLAGSPVRRRTSGPAEPETGA